MFQHRVGKAQIRFGVLEIDGIDFVWHRRASHLSRDDFLLEIAHRDVSPDVAREIEGDEVEAAQRVEKLRDIIVRFDLRGERIVRQPQRQHEIARNLRPGGVGIGRDVRVEIADGAVDFAQILLICNLL